MSGAEVLLERALDTDGGLLPSLTREELVALGDTPVLQSADDEIWWAALGEQARAAVVAAARRSLVARGLLIPARGTDDLAVADPVRIVLETRTHPSWLLVLREPTAAVDVYVVAAGIDVDDSGSAAVLLSARVEGIYLNRLYRPDVAIDEIAAWLVERPADEPIDLDRPVARTFELIRPRRPGVRDAVADRRGIVLGAGPAWRLADVDPDGSQSEPEPVDRPALRARLAELVLAGTR